MGKDNDYFKYSKNNIGDFILFILGVGYMTSFFNSTLRLVFSDSKLAISTCIRRKKSLWSKFMVCGGGFLMRARACPIFTYLLIYNS